MPNYRVLPKEQVKHGGKMYVEGDIITNMSKEKAELIPWAVEHVPGPKPRGAPAPEKVTKKAAKKKATKK